MNIVVLVKQVPAISDIEIAKDNNLVRVGAPSMLNPLINTPLKRLWLSRKPLAVRSRS